MATELTIW